MKALSIIGKIIQWTFTVIIAIIFIFSLILFISKLTSKEKLPMSFGYAFLSIETGSMEPTIMIDDVVIIHKVDSDDYQVGDVVAFWMTENDAIPTVHRIIERNGDVIKTKGDNPINDPDPEHNINDIIGKEVITIPKLGKVVDFLRKPVGIITVFICGFILIEVPSLISRLIHRKDENEPEEE